MCFVYGQWDFSRAERKRISHVERKNGTEIFCDCQPCFQPVSQAKKLQRSILTTSGHESHYVWCQPTQSTLCFQAFQKKLSERGGKKKKRKEKKKKGYSIIYSLDLHLQNKFTLQISAELASKSYGNDISDIPSGNSQQVSSRACFPLQSNKSKWNFLKGVDYIWESDCLRTNSLLNLFCFYRTYF